MKQIQYPSPYIAEIEDRVPTRVCRRYWLLVGGKNKRMIDIRSRVSRRDFAKHEILQEALD